MDPNLYMCRKDIFLCFLDIFFIIFILKDITTFPHNSHIMKDNYHHHNIMHDTTLLYSPVFTPLSPVVSKDFSP